jgi:DNA topoisomerase-1
VISLMADLPETARAVGLHYVTRTSRGILRRRKGKGFSYVLPEGAALTDPAELDRIKKLATPPAYKNVWICPDPKGHLQATGLDARGRIQYRYHPLFREARDETKFHRMQMFGLALPNLRERIARDMGLRGFPKDKVLAVVVYLLERSLIRVGNEEYAKENQSFGLTTMQTDHLSVHGSKIEFHFLGKSKIWHDIEIHDRRLARIIKKIQDLPGQELFHYIGDDGEIESISSADVNGYLFDVTGEHFTAKDFRTWWGTVLTLTELALQDCAASPTAGKRAISAVMKKVSHQLGNTPTVCRKCYVHPAVIHAFEKNRPGDLRSKCLKATDDPAKFAEGALLEILAKETQDK